MTVVVHTRQLTKNYGRREALHHLDLDLHAGEVYGLLGPNGAGKTTAIRLLMDLIRPTRGRIVLFGEDLTTGSVQARQRIGYVPGDLGLYGRLTGEEHLRLLAGLRGHPDLTDARVLAKRLDLDLSRRAGELSKGNRQKLGIVQAFLHRPELVILDEPASGLDPVAQREFHAHLREFAAEGGTALFSSHVLSEVEQVADRVGILLSGSLVVDAKVAALKAKALRALTFDFAEPVSAAVFEAVAGVQEVRSDGTRVHCRVVGPVGELVRAAALFPLVNVTSQEPDLQEIFLDYVEGEDRGR
ncbi:ABC-2 type transport system ATP-binding protein [Saccharothrix ecbatanensis]|uniref:ABC-2 type transport system ATP-binding protein n=1 Tax=Saccharothrix ecbatanensis TaxID=1105145 RepID=A0A7W9HFV0_9PSEU|nr:ABC transporter ATP-binding protein [Saccharothrix ecbatanensis]MBB5801188.1 ABC-2 type transport system ATP-binding protein [Saccharothrix ecbatanensis]